MKITLSVDGQSQQEKIVSPKTPRRLQAKLLDRWNNLSPSSTGSNGSTKKAMLDRWNSPSPSSTGSNGSTKVKKKVLLDRWKSSSPSSTGSDGSTKVKKKVSQFWNCAYATANGSSVSSFAKNDPSETNKSDKRMIRKSVKKNPFFDRMDSDELGQFVDSFEHIEVAKGTKIVTQGDAGDFFYIVREDSIVAFELDGVKIGEVEDGGSFGELALVYSCPRAATVVAMSSPTDLFRVDRNTLSSHLRQQIKSKKGEKIRLLEAVDFLSEMSEFDRISLARAMAPYIFQPGNVIVKKGDDGDAFHIVLEGRLKVTDISVGDTKFDDVVLGPGDYFGERSLATNQPTAANVVATTKGFGFRIDRHSFERVLGEFGRVIMKAQDRKILVRFVSNSPSLRSIMLIGTQAFFVDRTLSH